MHAQYIYIVRKDHNKAKHTHGVKRDIKDGYAHTELPCFAYLNNQIDHAVAHAKYVDALLCSARLWV